ncbi:MAG: InlB B-repeat-containing protein, partial [Oscillospiraceae bacterium]
MAKFRRITALVLVLIMSISLLGINVLASDAETPVVDEQVEAQVEEPAEEAPDAEAEAPAEDASSDTDVLSAPVGPGENGSRWTKKKTVYVYAERNDSLADPDASPNADGYYTLGTIQVQLPPASTDLYPKGTGNQYDEYKDAVNNALKKIDRTNDSAKANEWLKLANVEFYTLHCSNGATDYDAPVNAWHLDGRISAEKTHSLTYNANYGENPATYAPARRYVEDEAITLATLEATNFSREGYHFMGWSTDPDDDVAPPTTMGDADITLYAMWKENWPVGYFVLNPTETYPENGDNMGAENYTPYGEQTIGTGDTSYKVDVNTGYKGGLTQSGWDKVEAFLADRTNRTLTFTAADLQAPTGADLGSNKEDNITWYVIKKSSLAPIDNAIHVDGYVTNKPITITYYANYNGCDDTKVENGKTGEPHTVVANTFDRTGYTFNGWNTKADGTGTPYAAGDSIIPQTSMNLYAQWTKVETPKFTTSYSWTDADGNAMPADFPTAPTDNSTYDTEAAARNSVDKTFTSASVEYTATGMWIFSGWTAALTDTNVAFTGTWTFTPAGEVVDPSTASFTVKKVDENGNALKGAEFSLTKGKDSFAATVSENTFTFSNLPEGEYTLKETTAPDGYQKVDTEWTVTVAKGTATITVPSDTNTNIIHTIWNWIVNVTTGGGTENLLNTDGVLTVTNSKVPGTFQVYSYYVIPKGIKYGEYIDTYKASLPADSKLKYTASTGIADLTVDAINDIVTADRTEKAKEYPGVRLESADIIQEYIPEGGTKDWNYDSQKFLTITKGIVDSTEENTAAIDGFKIKSGLETRLHLVWELPHSVTYSVTGNVESNWTVPAAVTKYEDDTFTVAASTAPTTNPEGMQGTWSFSGWKVNGSEVKAGSTFTMPGEDVKFTGEWKFTEATKYSVTYEFDKTYDFTVPALPTEAN